MILSRRAALNGIQLDELYGRIVIRGIELGAPEESIDAASLLGGAGQRILRRHADALNVVVRWAMDEPGKDLINRRRIYEYVCKWARQKGWLTVNFMPDRRLYVDAVKFSGAELFNWTDDYEITFTANSVPFWQDTYPVAVSKANVSSASFSMMIPGQYRTVAEAEFTNTSGSAVSTFSVTVGGSTIALTDLSLGHGKQLRIYHEDNGILRITADGTSVYDKRSAASADDLYAEPGTAAVSMTAGGAGTLKVSCRGRYC